MNQLTAQIQSTLYVFGQRMKRNERGQTTAEYVGIVAFVAIIVVALFTMSDPLSGKVQEIINAAFDKIKNSIPG
jgi:Flp pilus assembly pilin Flp